MHSHFDRSYNLENCALFSESTPVEELIEPDNHTHEYREAAKRFIATTVGCIQFLREARDGSELLMRLDIISLIFCHPAVREMTLTDVGRKHNRTRAAVSAQILNFQRANHLPPTLAQKSVEARKSYSETRKSKLINNE